MANIIYRQFKKQMAAGSDAWVASDIRCMLINSTSTYQPNINDLHLSDAVTGGLVELSTTGYTAGGKALTGKSVANLAIPSGAIALKADNVAWLPLGGSGLLVIAALLYLHTGTNSTSDLIAYIDSIGPFPVFGANETIQWPPNGVFVIS